MYIELLEDQKKILESAIKKAGTYRKLSKILEIPRASIVRYKQLGTIPEDRFKKIIKFLELNESSLKIKKLDKNWKQILGGKMCVKVKKEKGTFEKQLKKAQESGAKKIKKWHKFMKENKPKEYHLMQYSKFRKVNQYKFTTKKGERVRNKLEKDTADILHKLKIEYQYEPLVRISKKYFFPDFLINNKIIVECTAWEDEYKAYKLRDKIKYLKKNYKVFVVIPKSLYSKYKILNRYLILGLDNLVPVAQTFLSSKK